MTENQDKILKSYELAFLTKEEADAQSVEAAVKSRGGTVKSSAPLKRTALAYKIKKESSAFFGVLSVEMEPAEAKALEHDLQMNSVVLRFLLIIPDPIDTGKRPSELRAPATDGAPRKREEVPGLSNEILQKQIEELAA